MTVGAMKVETMAMGAWAKLTICKGLLSFLRVQLQRSEAKVGVTEVAVGGEHLGIAIRARPMTSICRSPPESTRAAASRRVLSTGNMT